MHNTTVKRNVCFDIILSLKIGTLYTIFNYIFNQINMLTSVSYILHMFVVHILQQCVFMLIRVMSAVPV